MRRAISFQWQVAKKLILLGAVDGIFKDYPGESIYLATRSARIGAIHSRPTGVGARERRGVRAGVHHSGAVNQADEERA